MKTMRTDAERERVRQWHKRKYHADPEWAARRNAYARDWVARQRAAGLCTKCAAAATHNMVCEDHFWKGREQNWRKRGIPITLAEFRTRYANQGGACAICVTPITQEMIVVDHCHDTMRIRGLLCIACNSALGKLGDTRAAIMRVLEYIDEGVK